uniref:Photosystem I reaction center subunit III n=1 Tax=Lessonia spicata TaxID=1899210 RepID=A0A516ICR9_9PHAE|nr:photosystem I protein F [Lessonia spicata]YP_010990786.1 photosystem I subunit III [Lessonia nigrescens]QDP13914.1 photosystem I protein F [Lessonia spicata]QWK42687.1 photosystem I protein F [Lessonia spicata]WOX59819.1 photosystem I subunit III [Lessonia nigrescens]
MKNLFFIKTHSFSLLFTLMFNFKKSVLIFFLALSIPLVAFADVAGLTKCSESATFNKRLDASVKKLEGRVKKYEPGSPPALALEQQITRTEQRFTRYSNSELLCGKEGLPHLITDGRWDHAVEFIIPGMMFLYISGWIGWAGRTYLNTVGSTSNPTEKEIILDVPLALKIMSSGFIWPVSAWQEFTTGNFLVPDSEITVSPR